MLTYAELNALRREYAKAHGESATAEIINKHGGTDGALGSVAEAAWPAIAADLGWTPSAALEHVGKGRDMDSLYNAAYSRWNSVKRGSQT